MCVCFFFSFLCSKNRVQGNRFIAKFSRGWRSCSSHSAGNAAWWLRELRVSRNEAISWQSWLFFFSRGKMRQRGSRFFLLLRRFEGMNNYTVVQSRHIIGVQHIEIIKMQKME
jgi:hypothetical protein